MITFQTYRPADLLREIKRLIDQKHITTWSYDSDGDFTHCVAQWQHKAWLKPHIAASGLVLTILPPRMGVVPWEVYAVYQGRFIESLTAHAHDSFSNAIATASPTANDDTGSRAS